MLLSLFRCLIQADSQAVSGIHRGFEQIHCDLVSHGCAGIAHTEGDFRIAGKMHRDLHGRILLLFAQRVRDQIVQHTIK
ncbi:hypothetical protein GALL_546020 [mine drainage metagenome]|uniref:Uncharacterized protein n=1 Tax=mine drainage metagenome TaxID=410659 RepID=A0A1J5PK01_9ZZZZ